MPIGKIRFPSASWKVLRGMLGAEEQAFVGEKRVDFVGIDVVAAAVRPLLFIAPSISTTPTLLVPPILPLPPLPSLFVLPLLSPLQRYVL